MTLATQHREQRRVAVAVQLPQGSHDPLRLVENRGDAAAERVAQRGNLSQILLQPGQHLQALGVELEQFPEAGIPLSDSLFGGTRLPVRS